MDQKWIGTDKNKNHLAMIIERSTQDLHDRVNMQKYILLNALGKVKDRTATGLCPVESAGDEVTRKLFRKVLADRVAPFL